MTDQPTHGANTTPSPAAFDRWYAEMAVSPERDARVQQHLGLPPDLLASGLLGWDGIEDVTRALLLETGQLLLDLACGRGGYGQEVARRCGARLLGVDSSAEAISQATRLAADSDVEATFRRGAMESTGLEDDSVDAVMCIDAIQLSTTPPSAYAEMRRVVRPGGHVVITTWQPLDPRDESLPPRLRQVDPQLGLTAAGFGSVEVQTKPAWLELERGLAHDDPQLDRLVRVLATAVAL